MDGGIHDDLQALICNYISVEKEILKRVGKISVHYCVLCSKKCCREKFCRESLQSPFLRYLISLQEVHYDTANGWLSPHGCRLDFGRPLVCYEFFCRDIISDQNEMLIYIQQIIAHFIAIGNRARGNRHLICVEDLNMISAAKVHKIRMQLEKLLPVVSSEELPPGPERHAA